MRSLHVRYSATRGGDSSAAGCGRDQAQAAAGAHDQRPPGLGWFGGRPGTSLFQVPLVSGLVLINDACGDAPAVADRDPVVFRPDPDIAAALAA